MKVESTQTPDKRSRKSNISYFESDDDDEKVNAKRLESQRKEAGSLFSPILIDEPKIVNWIKRGKVEMPNQKPLKLETNPGYIQIAASFYQLKESHSESFLDLESLITLLDDEKFTRMIAYLVQESSETFELLTKRIFNLLNPCDITNIVEIPFYHWVSQIINRIASRIDYGLTSESEEMPMEFSLWRWEVNDLNIFPSDLVHILTRRKLARKSIHDEIEDYFRDLPMSARHEMLNGVVSAAKRKRDTEQHKKELEERRAREKKQKLEERELLKQKRDAEKEEERQNKLIEKQKRDAEKALLKSSKVQQMPIQTTKLTNFFRPVAKSSDVSTSAVLTDYQLHFKPYSRKFGTEMAPINPHWRLIDPTEFIDQVDKDIDIDQLKSEFQVFKISSSNKIKSLKRKKTPKVQSIWKLLQFAEDVRPPYFGTWTKSSKNVTGKTPFGKDNQWLDYDFDSEAEWEEDEPGEELVSENEEDEDILPADEDEDDGWMVPHGYLSDDEGLEIDADVKNKDKSKSVELEPKRKQIVQLIPVLCGPTFCFANDSLEGFSALTPFSVEFLVIPKNEDLVESEGEQDMEKENKTPMASKKHIFPKHLAEELGEQSVWHLKANISTSTLESGSAKKKKISNFLGQAV
ncbi:Chromatin assembly factor 1, subunit A [Globomyces sp. JEL0801]|nr:Chromatin assembly factor 1, subunit A [Globomyces sp. JEL0801]